MRTSCTLLAALVLGGALSAQTLIIPASIDAMTPGNASTSYPFNYSGVTDARAIYCYDADNFINQGLATPIEITQLRVRANETTANWTGGTFGTCVVKMGNSAVDFASLDATYDNNWPGGTAPTPAYSGPVTLGPGPGNGTTTPGPWYVTINFSPAVTYDPGQGDFLVEIETDTNWMGGTTTTSDLHTLDTLTSRCYDSDPMNATAAAGPNIDEALVIELTYSLVPGLHAAFAADKTEVGPGEPIQFTDLSLSIGAGTISNWDWDFDSDGSIDSTDQNPVWAYGTCGTFDVTLTVISGGSPNPSSTVRMGYIEVGAPQPSWTTTPGPSPGPVTVQFTDTSGGNPTAYAWDFEGDTVVDSTLQNPMFTFANQQIYDVTLTATNACGTTTRTIPYDARAVVCTIFDGPWRWNVVGGGGGNMVDIIVNNANGIEITTIGANCAAPIGTPMSMDVYTVPGTYAGNETSPGNWQLVSTAANALSNGEGVETNFDVPDFCLPFGSWGVAIFVSGGNSLVFTEFVDLDPAIFTGPNGEPEWGNVDLTVRGGNTQPLPFDPQTLPGYMFNGCFEYETDVRGTFTTIAVGCVGNSGQSTAITGAGGAVPLIGQAFGFDISGGPSNSALSFIMIGFANLGGLPLDVIGMPGCPLYTDGTVNLAAPTDAMGNGSAAFGIPNDQNSVGLNFWAQTFQNDPGANPFNAVTGDTGQGVVGCQ